MEIYPKITPTHIWGHKRGQGSKVYKNNRLEFIVWIPKNGSSTIRHRFNHNPDFFQNYEIDNYIIFLRDPIKRWISGMVEYMARWDMFFKSLKDIDLNQMEFDHHTTPQYEFLPDDYLGKSKFYNIDNGGLHIFNNEYKVWNTGIPIKNQSEGNPFKDDLYKELMSIGIPTQRIKEYYSLDYKLLEACGH
jgi:hypothetical protein